MHSIKFLETVINDALAQKGHEAASIFLEPKNARAYLCVVDGCERNAYANNLCNAHYMRKRQGKDLNAPVRARKRNDQCQECGEATGTRGGWGLCSKHYKYARYATIKDALIHAMGEACSHCGGKFHRSVFDFHHKGDKEGNPSYILASHSVVKIASEMSKCQLLCANCHRMEHANGL